jgi:hypothetical protein
MEAEFRRPSTVDWFLGDCFQGGQHRDTAQKGQSRIDRRDSEIASTDFVFVGNI